jgi:S-adenosylmethionine/arginine decarboxylase-like enzyme
MRTDVIASDAGAGTRDGWLKPAVQPRLPRARSGTYVPWGLLAAIDLHGCERDRLKDPDTIRRFVPMAIDAIGMRAHGGLVLDRFGAGELEGWSAMQFIQTSSITLHADEVDGRCFIDIFSCQPFDPTVAAVIAVEHFGGTATVTALRR